METLANNGKFVFIFFFSCCPMLGFQIEWKVVFLGSQGASQLVALGTVLTVVSL